MSQFIEMPKRGVIMDVVNVEEAKIAEAAGACAVMALERVPSDIRKEGGVARTTDPALIESIQAAVSIPVMAKVRIGHIAEARILEALNIDYTYSEFPVGHGVAPQNFHEFKKWLTDKI